MKYSIVRVNKTNYPMFDNMIFYRINGRERNKNEQADIQIDQAIYQTLEDKNLYIFAAQADDKFIGWISAVYIPKVGRTNGRGHLFIDELWVRSDCRRNGVAHTLMEKADAISKELNTLGLRLYVSVDNDDAILLYKKCGYGNQHEALFMEKEQIK
ncbi:MAG: GNAT family N-acetyltransferase [Clostridiaceae bacterium]|nr:GNAT family N-acetyltransferase [Eubacteriales bacterium]